MLELWDTAQFYKLSCTAAHYCQKGAVLILHPSSQAQVSLFPCSDSRTPWTLCSVNRNPPVTWTGSTKGSGKCQRWCKGSNKSVQMGIGILSFQEYWTTTSSCCYQKSSVLPRTATKRARQDRAEENPNLKQKTKMLYLFFPFFSK